MTLFMITQNLSKDSTSRLRIRPPACGFDLPPARFLVHDNATSDNLTE
jgi:hypothetical protein